MTTPRLPSARRLVPAPAALFGLLALLVLSGCGEEEPIRVMQVPKRHVLDQAARDAGIQVGAKPAAEAKPSTGQPPSSGAPSRMIAAIVPHGDQSWFFKLTGPDEAVAAREDEAMAFLKSVRFGEDGKPTWTLPEDWEQRPGNQFRYATLAIGGGEKPLELSVSSLSTTSADYDEYVLINVNRWRDQLGLKHVTKEQLREGEQPGGTLTRLDRDGATMTVINIAGTGGTGGTMSPPFASRGASTEFGREPPAGSEADGEIAFKAPLGWIEAANDSISRYAFDVKDGDLTGRLTISSVGGDLPENINRWRQQVGLPAWNAEEMLAGLQKVVIGGRRGYLVDFRAAGDSPSRKAILGAVTPELGSAWYFKLTGPAALIERQREPFESFLQSVKFE